MSPGRKFARIGLLLLAAACRSDTLAPTDRSNPITNPLGLLSVGDVIDLNVNANEPCANAIYHGAKVMAVGTRSIVLNDTLNPKNGFTTADFQKYAARFDTLVYPLDVEYFGEPTDIDKNGRIAILFTRVVNELTPPGSTAYVGGFAFSRDAFPRDDKARAGVQTCAGSNQGEYFYALTPDPTGSINGVIRSRNFVDSVTTPVLAHEFQHIINFTRRLYVNFTTVFEEKWLDEGLAHIAEELLFYRESGGLPFRNYDSNTLRANSTILNAYNADMSGNTGRYRVFLNAPGTNSPYLPQDSLATRGAAWSFLRYSIDRLNAPALFTPADGVVIAGAGSATVAGNTASASEYIATVVNTSPIAGAYITYTLRSSSGIVGAIVQSVELPSIAAETPRQQDDGASVAFESGLRSRERAVLTPMIADAQKWFRTNNDREIQRSASLSAAAADVDNGVWFKLVNSKASGFANLQAVLGTDIAGYVRDWNVSHAIDDVASAGSVYQQKSWNFHSIYAGLSGIGLSYPLPIATLARDAVATNSIVAGGASHYRIAVPAGQTSSISLSQSGVTPNATLQIVLVKTK